MKLSNYWERFLNTGKVDDYLAYREEKETEGPVRDKGADKGAGTGQCYRDGIEGRTDRGI